MLLGLLLLFAAFMLPAHYPPWVTFQQELLAALALASFSLVALMRARDLAWPRLAMLALALVAMPLAQFAAGRIGFLSDALLAALYLAGFGLSMVVGAALLRVRRDDLLDGMAGVFLAAAIVSVGVALAQWLELPQQSLWRAASKPGGQPFANLGQPNHLATLLALGLVGAVWLFQRRQLRPGVLALAAAFLCFGIALTRSRTGWLAIGGLAVWLTLVRDRASLRVGRGAIGATGLGFALLVMAWPRVSDTLYLSTGRTLQQLSEGGKRLNFWLSMPDAILRQPWFGYGWNQVSVAQGRVAPDHPVNGAMFEHSHNLVLDLLIWNGIPVGLLVVAALAWWFWRHARASRDPASALLLGGVGVVFLHALVEYPLDYAYFLLPTGLMMGAVEALTAPASGLRVPRWFTAGLAAAALALTALVAWEYLQIEADHRRMRIEVARIGAYDAPAVPVQATVLTLPVELIRFARTEATRNMTPEELARMRKLAERLPYPPVLFRYALAAGINGQPEEARLALVRLCKMSSPERCTEGRLAWQVMVEGAYPELAGVPLP